MKAWTLMGMTHVQSIVARSIVARSIVTQLIITQLIVASTILTSGLPSFARTPTGTTAQGDELLQKGWVDAAIEAFKATLKSEPQSLSANLGLARAYRQAGQLPAAWEAYQRVLALDSANPVALQAIGTMGEYRPEWQQAGIAAITQLLKTSPPRPQTIPLLTQRALLQGFQGKFDLAWADYAAILDTDISVQTALRAAQAAGFSGRGVQAIALYDRVLQQLPDNSEAQLNRAYFGLQARRISPDAAEIVLSNWLSQHPDATPPELLNLVGELPATANRKALYDRLLAQVPNNLPVQRRALQLLAQKSPDAARAQLAQLMAANPDQPLAYFVQAEVAKSLKDLNLAAQSYETLLQQQPDRTDALVGLGGVRFEQQRYGEAEVLFNRALVLMPDDWQIQRILADLYATQDRPNVALKLLRAVEKQQAQQGVSDPAVSDRIAQIEIDTLKRRSFQPRWERY